MYAIKIPEMVNPNNASIVFLIADNFEFINSLLVEPAPGLENIFKINTADHSMQIINNNDVTIDEVVLFVKNPPGYVAIMIVIAIKNKINNGVPYFEIAETFSKAFVLFFEYLKIS